MPLTEKKKLKKTWLQKGSKYISKTVHVTSVAQLQFCDATRILFLHKENKNYLLNHSSPPSYHFREHILIALQNWSWATDVTWTVLPIYLLHFWTWENFSCVPLLSMEAQIALRFHKKYLNLCFEDEQRFYGFGTTWGWVIDDIIFILGWTNPLSYWLNSLIH